MVHSTGNAPSEGRVTTLCLDQVTVPPTVPDVLEVNHEERLLQLTHQAEAPEVGERGRLLLDPTHQPAETLERICEGEQKNASAGQHF